jgi:hypothetical protein
MANGFFSGLLGDQDELKTPQQQALGSSLLMAGLQGLMASGPSLSPTSLGQILGQAGMTGVSTYEQSLQQAQAAQMARELQQSLGGGGGDPSDVAGRYREYAARLAATDPQKAKLYMDLAEKIEGRSEKFTGNLANAALELFGTADIGKLSEDQRKQAAEYYRQQELARAQAGASRQTVNVEPGVQVGSIPPGYALIKNEDGSMVMQPIAGGPAAQQVAQEAEKKEEGQAVTRTAAQTVFEDTTRALAVLERSPTTATGLGAAALRNVPGTDAKELQGHIDSIKGNIGIDQLLKIKASGAGLGQVPQSQLDMLASMLGNLDVTQNQRVLRENLVRVQEIYADIVKKAGGDPKQMMEERQQRQQTTPQGAKPLDEIFRK